MVRMFRFLVFVAGLIPITFISCQKDSSDDKAVVLTREMRLAMQAAADKIFAEYDTPGLLAVISVEGEPDYIIKRGTANLATGEPMSEHNAFRIGSVTKTFTESWCCSWPIRV